METKFTPGPWTFSETDMRDTFPYKVIQQSSKYLLAKVEDRYTKTVAEALSNTRLIAAAPEMYEALLAAESQLVYLEEKYPKNGSTATVLSNIRTVLAKAEGK